MAASLHDGGHFHSIVVARITRRRRQIRDGEIIFSDRRDRTVDLD